jgi:hypothetical protein
MQTKGKNDFFQTLRLAIMALVLFSGIAGFFISHLLGLYQHGSFVVKDLLMVIPVILCFWGILWGSVLLDSYLKALEDIKETDNLKAT